MRRIMEKMHYKKNRLGKKGGLTEWTLFGLAFSFISIIYIFISVFGYVVANDYIFVNMQNLTETLEEQGIVKGGTAALTQTYGEDFANFNFHLDDLWFIAYIIFVVTSLMAAYKSKTKNYFGFLGWLFYLIMVLLFVLTLFTTLTNWFNDEILVPMFPTIHLLVPKFYFYLNNIGIFSGIHLAIALLINMVDFGFSRIFQKKKLEQKALMDDEVL